MASEIDIEFAKWGNAEAEETLHCSVQPSTLDRIIRNKPTTLTHLTEVW